LTKPDGSLDDEFPLVAQNFSAPVRNQTRLGFWRTPDQLQPYYLIPRYYDPEIAQQLREFQQSGKYALKTIGELIDEGGLSIAKGHEIGSEAYGTGDVPFIRTSDIANWEITHDPTKSVSEEVYREYSQKQRLQAGDILFVNDGRYRIGNVCILTDYDTRIVIQSHFRVLRVLKEAVLSPYLLLYLLKTPFVRWQIQSKTFIQSTIATIGPRLRELVLPIPRDAEVRREIETKIERIVKGRAELLKEGQELDNLFADEEASPL
jgi:type I restriction enzyme M protein